MYLFVDNHAGDIYENTYVLLHWTRGGFVKTSTNLSTVPWCPLQQNNILLNIASITQSTLYQHSCTYLIGQSIDKSFYCLVLDMIICTDFAVICCFI